MSVRLDDTTIYLEGDCPAEDAETLLGHLQADPPPRVSIERAGHLHMAVLQVMLALRPELIGPATDPFLDRWLRPRLLQPVGDRIV